VPSAEVREVVGDYFGTLGVPLVRGRVLGAGDVEGAPRVVVVNQEMARRFWPNEDAIGRHLKLNPRIDKEWATVVGVVGDVRGYGLDQPAHAEVYAPHAQLRSSSNLCLIARTAGDPMPMAASARGVVTRIDPLQPVYDVRTMDDYVARSLAQRRFSLVLMLIFGGVALLLAAVGIYGVMSYTVAQRTSEIGIRIALGATPAAVLSMVVREGMTLVGAGLALGGIGALALTRLLASMLYGVSATDGLTYAAIAALLAGVALVAIVIPARRATRVDPMTALRAD
jgi:putative ABC transport system permease protein